MGQWNNNDSLVLQFGTTKALPDYAGEYSLSGSTREMEFLVPLVPVTIGGMTIPGIPTTFSGTSTYAAAGISNPDFLFPLQTTAVQTASGSALTITRPQLFIEQVQVTALSGAVGGTNLSIGLATLNPTNQQFVQVTPNAAVQLVNTVVTASLPVGQTVTWYQAGTTTDSVPASVAGGGAWIGQVPLVTNAITPLPQNAWVSAIATGTFTDGLLKVKVRYTAYGSINQ